ncbi:MAG: hypothetical protein J6V63_08225 [Spirochaetaceae bacterium]|nr:hypothetical protein [Spirochaetaceae bacterium]
MRRLQFISFVLILFTVMAFAPATTLDKRLGDFVLQVSDDVGAFNIRYAPEKSSSSTNFFVSHNDYATTYFSVLVDDTAYQLRRGSISSIQLVDQNDGAGLVFKIRDKLNVAVNLTPVADVTSSGQGAVKVEVVLENISSTTLNVALKGIFDTILGENSGVHFVTARYPYVSTEASFSDMEQLQWVRSSNGNESIQFLFEGNGISSPKMVVLANKDVVTSDSWMPIIKTGRTFNSVFSYNNSAICALWDKMSLTPSTKGSVTFYITLASKAKIPPTASFLGPKQGAGNLTDGDKILYTDEYGVVYTVGDITDSMLNMQYINDLLDRIRKLEEDPAHIDRNELLRLNAELDAILEKVRRL